MHKQGRNNYPNWGLLQHSSLEYSSIGQPEVAISSLPESGWVMKIPLFPFFSNIIQPILIHVFSGFYKKALDGQVMATALAWWWLDDDVFVVGVYI